jgi:Methyltransferase domain
MADDSSAESLSHRMREQRFLRFERLAAMLPKPLTLIDIGGTCEFWEQRGWAGRDDVSVTLVNLVEQEQTHENVVPTVGDATSLAGHADQSFDIAFSNSVIEHLFTFEHQQAMAREVRRVAKAYWVQTPNFWFPFEPHFLCPAWHWMPVSARVAILRRRGVGWMGRCPDPEVARRVVSEVRLMRHRELARLFPGAVLLPERFAGLVKSWTAIAGFPVEAARA